MLGIFSSTTNMKQFHLKMIAAKLLKCEVILFTIRPVVSFGPDHVPNSKEKLANYTPLKFHILREVL